MSGYTESFFSDIARSLSSGIDLLRQQQNEAKAGWKFPTNVGAWMERYGYLNVLWGQKYVPSDPSKPTDILWDPTYGTIDIPSKDPNAPNNVTETTENTTINNYYSYPNQVGANGSNSFSFESFFPILLLLMMLMNKG